MENSTLGPKLKRCQGGFYVEDENREKRNKRQKDVVFGAVKFLQKHKLITFLMDSSMELV